MISYTNLQLWVPLIQVALEHIIPYCIAIFVFSIVGTILLQTIISKVNIVISVGQFIIIG